MLPLAHKSYKAEATGQPLVHVLACGSATHNLLCPRYRVVVTGGLAAEMHGAPDPAVEWTASRQAQSGLAAERKQAADSTGA